MQHHGDMKSSHQLILVLADQRNLIRPRDLDEGVYDLTMQLPLEVWLDIPNTASAPKMDYPPLRIVRFSGAALTDDIEEQQIDGVTVSVTNVARTVADYFKFRNKIGLDMAMEAL
jgi:hypothetical protein